MSTVYDGGGIEEPGPETDTSVYVPFPLTWDATPQDVKDLLLHIPFTDAPETSNPLYSTHNVQGTTDEQLQRHIETAAVMVSTHLRNYRELPPRTQVLIRAAARHVVALGAAYTVQAANYPAAADPNDGTAYTERLWEWYKTALDALVALYNQEVTDHSPGAPGRAGYSFPPTAFPDGAVY